MVLLGYFGNRFGGLPSAIVSSIHSNGHQLRSGIAMGHYDFTLQAQGFYGELTPLTQLPTPLFIVSTSTCNWVALAARSVRAGSTPERAADVLE